MCLCLCCCITEIYAQEAAAQAKPSDSLRIQSNGIETTIEYYAEDSIVSNLINNTVYLYGKARVTYGDIKLTAEQIEINQNTKIVVARGLTDSTGRYRGNPVFKQGTDSYEADSMRYNFETKKGVVIGIVTEQGEGYIQSAKAKRLQDGTMYAFGNKYTTCNLKHPHWYINTNKIKLVPDKQVVSGPFNLVISDVPTPLGFAFGIFPFVDKKKTGIIFPTYGESADRGFFLRNGGYYWYISEFVTLDLRGEIYTNGSWGLEMALPYRKRYRYSGGASIRYNKRFQGEATEREEFTDFWIRWNHSPIPRGKSTFAASVNFGTTQFNRRNSFNPRDQLSNTFSSSISYNTAFNIGNTPVTLGLSARQDQNNTTNVMNVTLPALNLTVNRIYPFKKPDQSAKNFIQKINLNYSFNALAKYTNQPVNYGGFPFQLTNRPRNPITGEPVPSDSLQLDFNFANLSEIAKNARIGGVHTIPISTSIKFLKVFSLNPNFTYSEAWFPKQLDYTYIPADTTVRVDTLSGFNRVYSYSTGASLTTRIYGFFNFDVNKKGRYLQAIRHTIVPTITFSYQPELAGEAQGVFQNVQINALGDRRLVSRYQGFEPQPPASVGEAGVLNFNLQNIFEAKVKPKKDTVDEKKIMLLDNLSFGGNYNLVRDSLKLSEISIAARTRLLNLIDFNFTGALDPYVYKITSTNEAGVITQTRINRYAWQEGQGFGQLSRFNVSMGFSLTPQTFKNSVKKKAEEARKNPTQTLGREINESESLELQNIANNPDEYVDFDIPWSLNINYNINYNKIGFLESRVSQQINVGGDLSLTETWKIGFQTGYDFDLKQVSFTNIDISKDMHCWEMRINWNPFGTFKSYSFDLKVKSAILQDLKISRRRSFYDRNF